MEVGLYQKYRFCNPWRSFWMTGAFLLLVACGNSAIDPTTPGSLQLPSNDPVSPTPPEPAGETANTLPDNPVTVNNRPVAVLQSDSISVDAHSLVQFDGSASADPDGDPLSYQWKILSAPEGTASALSMATSSVASLYPDLFGVWTVELVVNDGELDSEPVIAKVNSVVNQPPKVVLKHGALTIDALTRIEFDGSESMDPEGAELTYRWTVVGAPAGATATLSDTTGSVTSLVPDLEGTWVIELEVSDGEFDSVPVTVDVLVK